VIYKGYLYSTLADVPVDVNQATCQESRFGITGPGPLPLPSGYSIASDNPDSIAVTAANYWSTDALVFSNGYGYGTLRDDSIAGLIYGSGYLSQSGSTYNVIGCYRQILITSNTQIATHNSSQ
jgi:hypothetical protein